ncbi:MAG TPA: hypothetical protein VIS96_04990, partial [Terrimicrobiaceae bacterium]
TGMARPIWLRRQTARKVSLGLAAAAKLSALANKLDQPISFLVIGLNDDGSSAHKDASWAKQCEEVVSQHVNSYLDLIQARGEISCVEVSAFFVVMITVQNPGEVTSWDSKAHIAAGTTMDEMAREDVLRLRIQLPGLVQRNIDMRYAICHRQ